MIHNIYNIHSLSGPTQPHVVLASSSMVSAVVY
jgi:hypothetical protein